MVTIINGEIVPDDDPRAQAYRQRRNNASRRDTSERATSFRGQTSEQGDTRNPNTNNVQGAGARGTANSMFYNVNNRLLDAGLPRLTVAGRVIEPLILIGVVLGVIFLGLRGLALIGVVYFLLSGRFGV